MRIIARQGPLYLLTDDEPIRGSGPAAGDVKAYVLDPEAQVLGPALSLGSILARGYWDEASGDATDLLRGVRRERGEAIPPHRR